MYSNTACSTDSSMYVLLLKVIPPVIKSEINQNIIKNQLNKNIFIKMIIVMFKPVSPDFLYVCVHSFCGDREIERF